MKLFIGIALISLLPFIACTQAPKIPELNQPKAHPIQAIALGNNLDAKDIRELFQALNQEGKLSSLKGWIEDSSDADLTTLGEFISKYLYQDAYDSKGLVGLIHKQISLKNFSALGMQLLEASKSTYFNPGMDMIASLFSHPDFPKLLERDSFLFNRDWLQEINSIQTPLSGERTPTSAIPPVERIREVKKALSSKDLIDSLRQLADGLNNTDLGHDFFLTVAQLRKQKGTSVFGDIAKTLANGLPKDSKKPAELERLLHLISILDQPSRGLFKHAQETLKTEEGENLIRLLGERFEPLILRGLTGFIRETLQAPFEGTQLNRIFWESLPRISESDAPTKAFQQLFLQIHSAIEKISSSSKQSPDTSALLNALVLTHWFENFAVKNKIQIQSLAEEHFTDELWALPCQNFGFQFNLLELDSTGIPKKDEEKRPILAVKVENELRVLGYEEFASDLKRLVKLENFGKTSYKFPAGPESRRLDVALADIVERTHNVHPFADPVPLFASLIYAITRSEGSNSENGLTVSSLESTNMLDSLNRILQGLSLESYRKLAKIFFSDLNLGHLTTEDKEKLISLYPKNPETAALFVSLVDNLQILYDLDLHTEEQTSLFEVYHRFLGNTRSSQLRGIAALFKFLSDSHLLGLTENSPNYPSVFHFLKSPQGLAQTLSQASTTTDKQQEALLSSLRSAFGKDSKGNSGIELHLNFLKRLIDQPEVGWLALTKLSAHSSLSLTPSSELDWLHRFISSRDHHKLWQFLVTHSSKANLHEIALQLEQLELEGALRDTFTLLGNLKNERMQRLALVLLDWENSRELSEFLSLIKTLTKG